MRLFVCVHLGRRQGRCFEQRAAEHQAASGGDGGGKEATGGGDGSGKHLPSVYPHVVKLSLNEPQRPYWSICSVIFAVKAVFMVFYFVIKKQICDATQYVSPVKLA